MAQAYRPPVGFEPPETDWANFNYEEYEKECEAYEERLSEEARRRNPGELVGEIVRFPMGDGAASYVVWKQRPLQLVHIATGDAWDLPEFSIRGIRISDIRKQVKFRETWAKLGQTNP